MVIKIKKFLVFISILAVFFIAACSQQKNAKVEAEVKDEAIKVIENLYKYRNERNIDEYINLLSYKDEISDEDKKNMKDLWQNIDEIKIIKVERKSNQETSMKSLEKYKNINQENLRAYEVTYDIKFKDEKLGVIPSGKNSTLYYLLRGKDSSHWLIGGTEGQGY